MQNLDFILKFNPHWQDGDLRAQTLPSFKRKLFSKITKRLDERFILCIQGLRRTGKSILQAQLLEELAGKDKPTPAKNILRYTFENEDILELLPSSELENLLELYFKEILKNHPQKIKERVIIALDEVQNVAHWQSVVKTYYDLNPNFKFIVTGSSSLFLQEGSESLAGRILEYNLPCFDFEEFLGLAGLPSNYPFANSIEGLSEVTPFYITEDIIKNFETFLLIGGFPDTALMHKSGLSIAEIQAFIRDSIISKVINKDLKKYFNLKNSLADQKLYKICAEESGSFVELTNLAREVGLNKITLKKHLDIFNQSRLLSFLSRYDRKVRREISATRKVYIASPSLMYALSFRDSTADSAFLGHAVETYAYQKLSEYEQLLYVEKSTRPAEEVDFYLPRKKLLLESKYSKRIDVRDFKYLKAVEGKLKAKGIVLTRDSWSNLNLSCLPVWLL